MGGFEDLVSDTRCLIQKGMKAYSTIGKPLLDWLSALILLVMLGWALLVIALVFVSSGNRPIFFFAERMGRDARVFRMIKFRTLHTDASRPVVLRRWWWGDFLRFTSLDELPQIWNVLKGDMSLIGPRPLPYEYGKLMDATQHIRHTVKPGITGWAQVNGRHGLSWAEKFALDRYYVENLSFRLDWKILVKTIKLLLNPKPDRSLDEKPFTGNHA